jgi:hypothetical protein
VWPSVPEDQRRMFHVEQGRFTHVSWH